MIRIRGEVWEHMAFTGKVTKTNIHKHVQTSEFSQPLAVAVVTDVCWGCDGGECAG